VNTSFSHNFILASTALLAASHAVMAQSRQVPAPPQNEPVAIVGAMIHPVSSAPINRGYVIFDNGRITAVGEGAPAQLPADAITLDGTGLHVYPGLILASTYLGLTEIGDVDQTNDATEMGRVKPEVRAAVAVNPDSDLIPVARCNGILTALVMPRGGLVNGRASVMRLDGWTWEDMALESDAGLCISWPRVDGGGGGGGRRGEGGGGGGGDANADIDAIDKLLDDANSYYAAREAGTSATTDLRYEALRAIIKGEKPVFISATSPGQIESAVAWAARRNVRIVIVGGTQADRCAALLKKHDIPVIVTGTHRLPQRRYEGYDAGYTLPARLDEAGVRFCITAGGEAAHDRNLNHMAASAAAYGLDKEQALRSVTLSAAEIIGQGQTLGSLEVGKNATLIVISGDPLEITSDTLIAFIDGRRIDLGSRQKSLYAKYQEKYMQLGLIGSVAKKNNGHNGHGASAAGSQ
jgi:imidazolonepropionase-like amidohydrolase